MIDIHCHILPGLDDGAKTLDDSLEMARMAVADGIQTIVATPHLFKRRMVDLKEVNNRESILQAIEMLRAKFEEESIALTLLPGCDFPLSYEALQLLEEGQALTINDSNHYLLLELPDTSFPPALDDIVFRLKSRGLTPIITHPERQFIIQEMPEKLTRLIDLGCLVQMTGNSLTGAFGHAVKKFSRKLVKKGHVHLLATDAHSTHHRPPELSAAVKELTSLVGESRAQDMVTTIPERIIQGRSI
jgi:protein-tyrosine phosphatase